MSQTARRPALSRRRFCQSLAATGLAAAAPAFGETFTGTIYKAVKVTMIRGDMPLLDKFKLSVDAGFDGISLFAPDKFDLREALAAQDKTGLKIHNINDATHWNVRLSDADPAIRQQALQDLKDAIQFAGDCGGDSVLLVVGKVTDPVNENHEQVRERSTAMIRQAIPLAARLGVRILCENVGNGFCPDARQWADYLDSFASPWVGSLFDIGNHHGYGGADHWIHTLGSRIVKIDVKDRNTVTDKNCNLFEGNIDWSKIQRELAAIQFAGWATAEVQGGDANRLRQVAQNMDKALGI